MSWTTARVEKLREYWKDGLSMAKIAERLGGFEHTSDKGRAAVCGMVKRFRDKAVLAGDQDEILFWTRGRTSGSRSKKDRSQGTTSPRTPSTPIHHENVAPARLRNENEPMWKGGAFSGLLRSRDNPAGLTVAELEAFAKFYT